MNDELTLRARERFRGDVFATSTTGIEIENVGEDYARCSLEITPKILNAMGVVMGGAVFTLADFAFAVAANAVGEPTVSLSSDISFLAPARGKKLTAEAKCLRRGAHVCFFNIEVTNDSGMLVASVAATGFRK